MIQNGTSEKNVTLKNSNNNISNINNKGQRCELVVYDINRTRIKAPDYVRFVGRTDDVRKALLNSDLLLNLDGDDQVPVFISSKLKEYLCCCRPILSITPEGSPSRELTEGLSTVFSVANTCVSIEKQLLEIISQTLPAEMFKERMPVIQSFTPQRVASIINERMLLLQKS